MPPHEVDGGKSVNPHELLPQLGVWHARARITAPRHAITALRSGSSVVGSPGVAERVGPARHRHKAPQRHTRHVSHRFKDTVHKLADPLQACKTCPAARLGGSLGASRPSPAVHHGNQTPPHPSVSLLTAVLTCSLVLAPASCMPNPYVLVVPSRAVTGLTGCCSTPPIPKPNVALHNGPCHVQLPVADVI